MRRKTRIFFKTSSCRQSSTFQSKTTRISGAAQERALKELFSNPKLSSEEVQHLLDTLIRPDLQCKLARAVLEGKFRDNPEILEVIAFNLDRFEFNTDMMSVFASAIRMGQFENCSKAIGYIVDNINGFSPYEDQRQILYALLQGRLGQNHDLLCKALRHLLDRKTPNILRDVADSLLSGKVRIPKLVTVIAERLDCFRGSAARYTLFVCVEKGCFGKHDRTMRGLIQHLDVFDKRYMQSRFSQCVNNGTVPISSRNASLFFERLHFFADYKSQISIVEALIRGDFGENQDDLACFAQHCTFLTGYASQAIFTKAVCEKRFGYNPSFYMNLARNMSAFTGFSAQRYLTSAVMLGVFGRGVAVISEVASHCDCIRDGVAQTNLAKTFVAYTGQKNDEFLNHIAKNCVHLTDPNAQWNFYQEFRFLQWPKSAARLLVENLVSVKGVNTQAMVVRRLTQGHFGRSAESIACVLAVPWIHHYMEDVLPFIQENVRDGDAKLQLLTSCKYVPETFSLVVRGPFDPSSFFGSALMSQGEIMRVLSPKMEAFGLHAEDFVSDAFSEEDLYAVWSGRRGDSFFIIKWCATSAEESESSTDVALTVEARRDRLDQFKGWVTCREFYLYQPVTAQIRVLAWTQGAPYPAIFDANHLTLVEPIVRDLPPFLRCAVYDNCFKLDDYKTPQLLSLILEDVLVTVTEFDSELAARLKTVIERAIALRCSEMDLNVETIEALDAESTMVWVNYQAQHGTELFQTLRQAMVTKKLLSTDIAKVAFLCLQLSKAGILGYHRGEVNVANYLLYSLGKGCVRYLAESCPALAAPLEGVISDLDAGICAQTVSQKFNNVMQIQAPPHRCHVTEIFDKLIQ